MTHEGRVHSESDLPTNSATSFEDPSQTVTMDFLSFMEQAHTLER